MHRLFKILTSRMMITAVLILIQLWFLFMWFYRAAFTWKLSPWFNAIAIVFAIIILNRYEDSEYKIVWSILILAVPIVGIPLYLVCGNKRMPKKLSRGTSRASEKMQELLQQDGSLMNRLAWEHPQVHKMFAYALKTSRFPVYDDTNARFFASGEEWFPVLLEELKKAEHFIFMEYFIIDEGKMWNSVLEILKQKAAAGVEVKLIYDDFGCATTLPYRYDKKLNEMGIETYRFNRLRPALMIQMNNRDHRKICVVDNRVGFTGGVNLADEYINLKRRYGYWRDSVLMLEGEAVWSLSDMFLSMYSYLKPDDTAVDYEKYHIVPEAMGYHGLYQPFSDTPTDDSDVGLSMHLNIVNHARKYVYINTPYLVLNADMLRALTLSAETGVDVRILVPHIPDKRYVFSITRSNYYQLLINGVRIYEFTPGFNHSKAIVSDDSLAIVGSVNTDYRSYFLHFEDGVLMFDSPEILQIRKDFEQALERSHEVTLEEVQNTNPVVRIWRAVLRLMAPLF
ncbi:MAG: cardiolipin synthase [Solobacterium sp.]|nr:cardiolipin synthase [Solobacterium sp.]